MTSTSSVLAPKGLSKAPPKACPEYQELGMLGQGSIEVFKYLIDVLEKELQGRQEGGVQGVALVLIQKGRRVV